MRVVSAFFLAVCLFVSMIPGRVSASEPGPPVAASIPQFVVDPSGPDNKPGVWIWSTEMPSDLSRIEVGQNPRWHFIPMVDLPISGILDGQPVWPNDFSVVHVVPGVYSGTSQSGSWLWNPYAFVGGTVGPVFWVPGWVFILGQGTVETP